MIGVHGNGLTHLLWMDAQNPRSTVIELFYPGGFSADYEFTARSIGIRHYGVWDDQVFTDPDTPQIAYPEVSQSSSRCFAFIDAGCVSGVPGKRHPDQ